MSNLTNQQYLATLKISAYAGALAKMSYPKNCDYHSAYLVFCHSFAIKTIVSLNPLALVKIEKYVLSSNNSFIFHSMGGMLDPISLVMILGGYIKQLRDRTSYLLNIQIINPRTT